MPRILVVDDNPGDRGLAKAFLSELPDLTILEAEDGQAGLDMIGQAPVPDLVLTDLRMPKVDGLELVRTAHQQHPEVPIILMTSFGNEQVAVEALGAGAASYVPKSHLADDLLETAERVMRIARIRHQRKHLNRHLESCEMRFTLDNDPTLIPALIGALQENIERMGFGDENERTRVAMALQEALDNALYHGNLEVSSDLKETDRDAYYELAQQRRDETPYLDRRIHVTVCESRQQVKYVIRDEGPGFNPDTLPDPTLPENMERASGRGLLLIRTFMDQVNHNDTGNQVTLVKLNPNGST